MRVKGAFVVFRIVVTILNKKKQRGSKTSKFNEIYVGMPYNIKPFPLRFQPHWRSAKEVKFKPLWPVPVQERFELSVSPDTSGWLPCL